MEFCWVLSSVTLVKWRLYLLGKTFTCGENGVGYPRFLKKNKKFAHYLVFTVKIGVVTVLTSPILAATVKCTHCVPIF